MATVLCIGLAAVLAAGHAAAQGDAAGAKAAFARGSELFDKGDYVGAADAFREANRLNPSWKLFYNIGQAEAAAKRYGMALEAFELYLAQGGDEIAPDRNEEVIAEVKRLRELVGSLDIAAPAGAIVFVDDVERGPAPLPGVVKVAAGVDHTVRAEKDGAPIATRTVRVSGGDTLAVDLGAPGEGPSPAGGSAGAAADGAPSPLVTWGWVSVGVGAAALIAGGVVGGVALKLDGELEDGCPGGGCPPELHDKMDRRDALGVTSTALIAAGAAIAATGVVLLVVGHKGAESNETPAVSLLPAAAPGFAGASLTGRF